MAIWADAVFVWDPGDAVTASSDEITSASASGTLAEGAYTATPRPGRVYTGAQGTRFAFPGVDWAVGATLMVAYRRTSPSSVGAIVWWGQASASTRDSGVHILGNAVGGWYRFSTFLDAAWERVADTDIHVAVVRFVPSDGAVVAELFYDGPKVATGRMAGGSITVDRLTLGRFDDSTPTNGTDIGVYAATAWTRPLTDAEIRAVISDPYSYPTDPVDPDDWPKPIGEWAGSVFYWDAGHGGRSRDLSVGSAASTAALTDGTEVTVAGRPGRRYVGAQGSRFDREPLVGGKVDGDWTWMAVVQGNGAGAAIYGGDSGDEHDYLLGDRGLLVSGAFTGSLRTTSTTQGTSGWPMAEIAAAADTDLHVLVARHSGGTVDLFIDTFANSAIDTETLNPAGYLNRVTIGRIDDSTPSNSTDISVFADALWSRKLTDAEVIAVLADPYSYPGVSAPSAPTNPAAVALSSSSIRVTWVNVADETGYRVERSPNGTTGWTDVSGSLVADTVLYDDTGLTASTQYFYRVYAFNAGGDSPASTVVNATTDAAPSAGGNRMGGTGAIRKPPR